MSYRYNESYAAADGTVFITPLSVLWRAMQRFSIADIPLSKLNNILKEFFKKRMRKSLIDASTLQKKNLGINGRDQRFTWKACD